MSDPAANWSVPVGTKWEAFGQDLRNFLQAAHAENFQPRQKDIMEIQLGDPVHRSISLVYRGRKNGYEPFLWDQGRALRLGPHYGLSDTACVCVQPPFYAAGYFALEWMRGRSLEQVLSCFEYVAGKPEGIVLHSQLYDVQAEEDFCADHA